MIKKLKDYIPEVTRLINEDSPVTGMKITDEEVRAVIRYYLKNLFRILSKLTIEVNVQNIFWFFSVKTSAYKHLESRKRNRTLSAKKAQRIKKQNKNMALQLI